MRVVIITAIKPGMAIIVAINHPLISRIISQKVQRLHHQIASQEVLRLHLQLINQKDLLPRQNHQHQIQRVPVTGVPEVIAEVEHQEAVVAIAAADQEVAVAQEVVVAEDASPMCLRNCARTFSNMQTVYKCICIPGN